MYIEQERKLTFASPKLTLLLPASEAQQALHDKLAASDGVLRYARVYMKLIEIISGDFFNSYIKAGNIVMLSEGRAGTDNVFSLSDGILRMEVDKPTFEKLGLEGKAVGSEGRKHVKARFGECPRSFSKILRHRAITNSPISVIELNLRLPSMLPGKKAFDRLIWACKNVLDSPLTWLFYDFRSPTDGQGPIAAHAPTVKVLQPVAEPLSSVLCPAFPETIGEEDRDEIAELLEWIQMTMARSPRVLQSDNVDPYICRYRPAEDSAPANLVLYQWHGFVPPSFATKVLLAALKATGSSWFALEGEAFGGAKGYTVLRNGGNVMTWKYAD